MIKKVAKNVHPENIPFNHDPLTLILKEALVGENAKTRMFVNISPSIFDTPVTNRSLKFAKLTGRIQTKVVDLKNLKKISNTRDELFQKNNLKILKCSPVD